ncbi:MAG: hypothetical protein Q6351_006670 [Candidatus Njordarchaeum guaymaensis]
MEVYIWKSEYNFVMYSHSILFLSLIILTTLIINTTIKRKKLGMKYQAFKYLAGSTMTVAFGLLLLLIGAYLWKETILMNLEAYRYLLGSYIFFISSTIFWILFVDEITNRYKYKSLDLLILTLMSCILSILTITLPGDIPEIQSYLTIILTVFSFIYFKSSLHMSLYGYSRIRDVHGIHRISFWIYMLNFPMTMISIILNILNRLQGKFFGIYVLLSWILSLVTFILLYISISMPKWFIKLLKLFKKDF